jgi:uncharacterized protein (DUF4415 family)
LAKVDAHVIQPEEYEEAPELTDEMIERAELRHGDKVIRRGRPPLDEPKVQVTLRLDPDVLAALRATGAGWQSRVNALLRKSFVRGKHAGR